MSTHTPNDDPQGRSHRFVLEFRLGVDDLLSPVSEMRNVLGCI